MSKIWRDMDGNQIEGLTKADSKWVGWVSVAVITFWGAVIWWLV